MDLNYLLGRHQLSLHNGGIAASPEARWAHRALAASYFARIRILQAELGARAPLGGAL